MGVVGLPIWDRDQSAKKARELGDKLDTQLGRAARWVQQRTARTPKGLPALTPTAPAEQGAWSDVAGAVQLFAAACGVVGADAAVGLLKAMFGVEDQQTAMLRSIERDVRLLREGPFRSGRLLLREADRIASEGGDAERFIEDARSRFYDAHELATSLQERALVEFHLGLVWLLLGKRKDSEYWLKTSHDSTLHVVSELASQSEDVKVLHSQKSTALWTASGYGTYYVLPKKIMKIWSAQRAALALEAFVPFANGVASSLNALTQADPRSTLEFSQGGDGTYVLRELNPEG